MKRVLFFALSWLIVLNVVAQTTNNKKPSAFKTGGNISIMGAQSGSQNWSQGAEKFSVSAIASLQLFANYTRGKNSWENNLDFAYGLVNTSSHEFRKVDDKFDLYSRFSRSLKKKMSFGAVANLRTQFTNGYDYSEAQKKRISGFFAPAHLTFSPGIQWKPCAALTTHVGPAIRWIIISNSPYSLVYQGAVKPDGTTERTLASLYDVKPGRELRLEFGPYWSTTFQKEIVKNVAYRGRLDFILDVLNEIPNNQFNTNTSVDVYMTNNFTMSVNKWLKVNYSLDLVVDENIKMFGLNKDEAATQLKSILGVGLSARF